MNVLECLKSHRLYFDGGLGTMLQAQGLEAGEFPELWNIKFPEKISDVHYEYLKAGCNILTTNTFGANRLKFNEKDSENSLEKIISAAVKNAKNAIERLEKKEEKFVALDIGPSGRLLKPLGDLDFEEAVSIFADVVKIGVQCGVDLIIIETMSDSYETKAAVLAAKENSNLPIFVTNAYDESGKLMTGASPSAMVAMLEGLRVDALGINCSLGPKKMKTVVKNLIEEASVPVIVSPNAGLPVIRNGKTTYELSPCDFAKEMKEIAEMGVSIMGGCCGTTPGHIQELIESTKDIPYSSMIEKNKTVISSYTKAVEFNRKTILIGERINPTGKPAFKEALRQNNFDYILREGLAQEDLGADVLDVNVGLPEIDEVHTLVRSVCDLQSVTDLPLQIDTSNAVAMEAALRIYNGKPLINSVNGKKESMDEIFPLAAKYGGVIIALTLDENGIPETVEGRVVIAEKIVNEAAKYGISKKDIIVDPLALTISSDPNSAKVTLGCIKKLREMGIKTSLGVSNVSFGLPQRGLINATFFTLAMQSGLSAAIINPHARGMMDAYYAFSALSALDDRCEEYINYATKSETENIDTKNNENSNISLEDELKQTILRGLKDEAPNIVEKLLKKSEPLKIINESIIPALDEIGVKFENKTAFLPQLLMSAETAKAAFEVIKKAIVHNGEKRDKKMKIVLATVKGDIHDIGKNIVKTLLENYDFEVIDLGKDVPPETIVKTVKSEGVRLVGLSALMTTTVPAMEETIKLLKQSSLDCRVIVGGAVLTKEYADMIGADKYAKDAMEAVRYAEQLQGIQE